LSTGNKIRDPLRKTLVDIMQTPSKATGEPFEDYDDPTLKFAAELALAYSAGVIFSLSFLPNSKVFFNFS
jgi:hypothetical protein